MITPRTVSTAPTVKMDFESMDRESHSAQPTSASTSSIAADSEIGRAEMSALPVCGSTRYLRASAIICRSQRADQTGAGVN